MLQNGDRNISFFHKVTVSRQSRNKIVGLQNQNGDWISDREGITKVAMEYFESLFTVSEARDDAQLFGMVKEQITPSMN